MDDKYKLETLDKIIKLYEEYDGDLTEDTWDILVSRGHIK